MAVVTYPLNDTDYDASDAELFHCTRTSGVFEGDDFECSVTGADNYVTVGMGVGWIRNSRFSGKVIAQKNASIVDMGMADSLNPRIDAVVIRFDANSNKTSIVAKAGAASENPVPPEVVRTESIYELHLCHVRREAGAASISISNLTDLRANKTYCGRMQDDVTPSGAKNEDCLPLTGGAVTGMVTLNGGLTMGGKIVLKEGENYGSGLPASGVKGQLFLVPVKKVVV